MRKILIPLVIAGFLVIALFLLFEGMEDFFAETLNQFRENHWRYAAISFLILVSDIVLPVPSSVVMYSNGVFLGALRGFFLSLVSANCSAVIGYYLGKYSSKALKAEPDRAAAEIMRRYGHFAVVMTRGVPILAESVAIVCGYNRYNFKTYLLLNLAGYFPVCLIYAYFGSLAAGQNLFLASFGGSLAVSFLLWLFGRKLIGEKAQARTE